MTKNLEIERLRAIAVIMIFSVHCGFIRDFLPALFRDSRTGVDLFFVISGYVVTCSLLRSLPDLVNLESVSERMSVSIAALKYFFLRRVFRILPAAYFWLAVYLLLAVVFKDTAPGMVGTPKQIFKEIIYFSSGFYNYLLYANDMAVHYVGHYWSLTVEEHFYLLLPFLLILVPTRSGRIISSILVVLIVAAVLRPLTAIDEMSANSINFFTSHRRFDALALGVLLALVRNNAALLPSVPSIKTPFLVTLFMNHILPLALIVFLWCAVLVFPDPFRSSFGLTIYALYGLGLVTLASYERNYIFNYPFINRALEFIGERSYTIYLSHIAVICLDMIFTNWLKVGYGSFHEWLMNSTVGTVSHAVLIFSFTLAISDLAYRLLEKPLVRYASERYRLSPR